MLKVKVSLSSVPASCVAASPVTLSAVLIEAGSNKYINQATSTPLNQRTGRGSIGFGIQRKHRHTHTHTETHAHTLTHSLEPCYDSVCICLPLVLPAPGRHRGHTTLLKHIVSSLRLPMPGPTRGIFTAQ